VPHAKIIKELVKRAQAGDSLAMDFASRMSRAKEQGFDVTNQLLHGTTADIKAFQTIRTSSGKEIPTFLTNEPEVSNQFSRMNKIQDDVPATVLPVFTKATDTFDFRNKDHVDQLKKLLPDIPDRKWKFLESGEFQMLERKDVGEAIQALGFDSFNVMEGSIQNAFTSAKKTESLFPDTAAGKQEAKNLFSRELERWNELGEGISRSKPRLDKRGGNFRITHQGTKADTKQGKIDSAINTAVFDPKNIRSVNAAFDPAKRESSNLLAEVAPIAGTTGILGAGSLTSPQAQANIQKSIDELKRRGLTHLIPHDDKIQGAIHPRVQTIATMLGNIQDPLGNPFESASKVLGQVAFGDSPRALDIGLGALEVFDPSNLPALGGGIANFLFNR